MRIRAEQMEAFREAAARGFEDEMIAHLEEFSPPLFRVLKVDGMRIVVQAGVRRAAEYEITLRGPVRLYLELMLLFGSDFDTDPQYPWAQEILEDRNSPAMFRAGDLHEKACDYRDKVIGPDDAYALAALKRLSHLVRQPLPESTADFASTMKTAMARVYPEKVDYIGAESLEALIGRGIGTARNRGFSRPRAVGLAVVLMFAFGHGCFHDPLYPWIGRTAEEAFVADPNDRAARLEDKAVVWLDHVIAQFEGDGQP